MTLTQPTTDAHQVALWRLAAVQEYLYETMGGDHLSSAPYHDTPLPQLSTEPLREAQRLLDEAIKQGQRARRSCIGGELRLVEDWKK